MEKFSVCRLCGEEPELFRDELDGFEGASCSTHECPLYNVEMSRKDWEKLNSLNDIWIITS